MTDTLTRSAPATTTTTELVDRYVDLWNEPDADVRRRTIAELWTTDGAHVLVPPQDMRDAARAIGFPTMTLEVHGHDELAFRVATAQHDFVEVAGFRFRSRGDAERLGPVVKFHWEMVPATGGEVAAVGLEVLLLDDAGRIRTDHQFIEG